VVNEGNIVLERLFPRRATPDSLHLGLVVTMVQRPRVVFHGHSGTLRGLVGLCPVVLWSFPLRSVLLWRVSSISGDGSGDVIGFPEVVIVLGEINGLRGASTKNNPLSGDDRLSGFAPCGPREICPHGERFFLFFAQGDLGFELIHQLGSVSRRVATELGQNLFVTQRCANRGSKGRTWHKYSGDERLNRSAEIVRVPHHG
jgi:hypothetical protein